MTQTSDVFEKEVLKHLETQFRDIEDVRASLQAVQGPDRVTLLHKIQELSASTWRALDSARKIDRRLRQQVRRASEKFTRMQGHNEAALPPRAKSKKRQEAGKGKATSLGPWRAEFSEARQELKDEGYTGSLKLKRGMPLYDRIQAKRQAKMLRLR